MRNLLIALTIGALGAQAGLQDDLLAMERQFFTAWQSKSLEAVEKNIAAEGVSWSEYGSFDKTAQIANQKAANANCNVAAFAFSDVRVIAVSANSAMLLYTVSQDAACGASKAPSPVANSSLWVKRAGRWQNVYRASVFPRK